MPGRSSGMVTFLFADIKASIRLWEENPEPKRGDLRQHDDLLRACVKSHVGHVLKTIGDAFHAARQERRAPFPEQAVAYALEERA